MNLSGPEAGLDCEILDDSRLYAPVYNHQPIDAGNANQKDYFHFSAPDFTKAGFSNNYWLWSAVLIG